MCAACERRAKEKLNNVINYNVAFQIDSTFLVVPFPEIKSDLPYVHRMRGVPLSVSTS